MVGISQVEPKIVFKTYSTQTFNYADIMGLPYLMEDSSEYLVDTPKTEAPHKNIRNLGWFFHISNSKLYSDAPQYFRGKKIKLKQIEDEMKIIMNMEKGTLKLIVDDEDKGALYENIPTNEPIVPAVLLNEKNDSVKIIPC